MSKNDIKSHCNTCGPDREHLILHHEVENWGDDHDDVSGSTIFQMVKCGGCGAISLRREVWCSEYYDEEGHPESSVEYFPPRVFRKLPAWHSELQTYKKQELTVSDLLQEVYVALQNDLRRLTAMGIRSLLEHIMIDKVGDKGTFQKNINEFASSGFISKLQKGFLETALEAGHASIHRDFKPNVKTLISLIDISESLIQTLYIHERQTEEIRAVTPVRKNKK